VKRYSKILIAVVALVLVGAVSAVWLGHGQGSSGTTTLELTTGSP
jgi:hypothetical protein